MVGKEVFVQITAKQLTIIYKQDIVATHLRCFNKGETQYHYTHYLSVLKQKPGALRNEEPFLNWDLPDCITTLKQHLLKQPKGDKAMVKLLSLIADFGKDIGITASELALEQGMPTVDAVLNIILRLTELVIPKVTAKTIELAHPPKANLLQFDQLLPNKKQPYHY